MNEKKKKIRKNQILSQRTKEKKTNTRVMASARPLRYCLSGSSAVTRISPILESVQSSTSITLLPSKFGGHSLSAAAAMANPAEDDADDREDGIFFLWENTPTKETKKKVRLRSCLQAGEVSAALRFVCCDSPSLN